MSAFAAGVERWVKLMQTLAGTPAGSPEFQQAILSLREDLATQLDAWLRKSHPFTGPPFGPPLGPSASTDPAGADRAHGPDAARVAALLGRWVHLQSQVAVHWGTVGRAAAEKFAAELGRLTPGGSLTDLRKLYDLWIDCAEEAYAQTAHSDGFAQLVADVINTAVALQLEGRQYLQQWIRVAGLPTREEIDALAQRIDQLEQRQRSSSTSRSPRKVRSKGARRP